MLILSSAAGIYKYYVRILNKRTAGLPILFHDWYVPCSYTVLLGAAAAYAVFIMKPSYFGQKISLGISAIAAIGVPCGIPFFRQRGWRHARNVLAALFAGYGFFEAFVGK